MADPQRKSAAPPRLPGARFLVVEARYYEAIGEWLLQGAGAGFDVVSAPGALEIPAAVAIALDAAQAKGQPYEGVVTLGCVIRGETYHFEIVAGESARALMDMSVARKLALGNGILTTENTPQAEERADPARGDKGGDAARAALLIAALKRSLA
jgi:6,7-dimethyl-8-ribityllumazine synthase